MIKTRVNYVMKVMIHENFFAPLVGGMIIRMVVGVCKKEALEDKALNPVTKLVLTLVQEDTMTTCTLSLSNSSILNPFY